MGPNRGIILHAALLSLCSIAAAVVGPTGCSDTVENPGCDLFMGSAIAVGVARDFDGYEMAETDVEFAIADTGQCTPDFRTIVGRGRTDQDGGFEVLMQSGNTVGTRCVFGRVVGSDSISIGRVDFVSDCRRAEPKDTVELELIATPSAVIPADLSISLYRQHAWNAGPHYSVELRADGYVRYEGLDSVLVKGVADTTIALESVARLYRAFDRFGFRRLKSVYREDECGSYAYDIYYASTSLTENGTLHVVLHDHGCCGIRELEQLTYLECKIDSVLGTTRWTGAWARPCTEPFCPPSAERSAAR